MRTSAVKAKQWTLLLGDALVLYGSLWLMTLARYGAGGAANAWQWHFIPFTIIFALWVGVFYMNGLYNLYMSAPSAYFYRRFSESWITAFVLAITLFYLLPIFTITPKTNLIIVIGVSALLMLLWRASSSFLFVRAGNIRVLLVDPNSSLIELAVSLTKNPQFGYEIVGAVSPAAHIATSGVKIFPHETPLRALVAEHNISMLVVGSLEHHKHIHGELYELLFWNIPIVDGTLFYEQLTGRVPLDDLTESWFFHYVRPERAIAYDAIRTIMDYFCAIIGFVVLLVILPIIAALIKLSSRGPVFYHQERVGQYGKTFRVLKFRTMKSLAKDGGAETQGAELAIANDPRITAIGKWIRLVRLDELPQVINVISGDMSIIGPRPERPSFVYEFERKMPFYAVRNLVKPGITGWAQVNYSYAATFEEQMTKFQYDLFYLKNRSLFLDITIVIKTIRVILHALGQ